MKEPVLPATNYQIEQSENLSNLWGNKIIAQKNYMSTRNISILMADLTGYTAMTEVHGAESALTIITKYLQFAERAMHGNARLLERVGDQLVIVSSEPVDIAVTALELMKLCAVEPEFLLLHAGAHYGTVLENKGSFFGSAMNLTARITSSAPKGKVLCSADFINQVVPSGKFQFEPMQEIKFKNIMQPVDVGELVLHKQEDAGNLHIDPVCHMLVNAEKAFNFTHNGKTYHFCSDQCLKIFIKNPV